MPSLLHTFIFIALISFVLAAPFPEQIQKRSFKVERVPNPKFKRAVGHKRAVGAGTRALVRAYRKYGMPVPEALTAITANAPTKTSKVASLENNVDSLKSELGDFLAGLGRNGNGNGHGKAGGGQERRPTQSQSQTAAPTSTGSSPYGNSTTGTAGDVGLVTAQPTDGDTEYISPVIIGGQTINMDFDSGSSDLWVFNTQLAASSQQGHTNFDPKKSTTFKHLDGSTFSISYGDSSGAAGTVGTDTVDIGGATVTAQAVQLATAVSQSFIQDTASNGLVGLAFSKLNTVKPQPQKTFFDNAIATLAEPVFTADLHHAASGSYEFGNIDNTKFTGDLQWADVDATTGFWEFTSEKFTVNGATTNLAGGTAIADTGTTLMLVESSIVNAYYSNVSGAVNSTALGGVTFPCNATLPDLSVDIGGAFMATVRGEDINFAPADASGTTCYGGLQAIDPPLQIYGDIFFKSNFVAFNGGNNSIGVAPHA